MIWTNIWCLSGFAFLLHRQFQGCCTLKTTILSMVSRSMFESVAFLNPTFQTNPQLLKSAEFRRIPTKCFLILSITLTIHPSIHPSIHDIKHPQSLLVLSSHHWSPRGNPSFCLCKVRQNPTSIRIFLRKTTRFKVLLAIHHKIYMYT